MHVFKAFMAQDLYLKELQTILNYGDVINVRGTRNMELLNVATVVEYPQHPCILIPSRHWNPWLAMSEALWILSGRNDIAALLPYNRSIIDYSDNGVTLYGAYGKRMFQQIDRMIERLQKEPTDRRAVLQIWSSIGSNEEGWWDIGTDSKDPPCNDMVMFKLRKGMLHMTVLNRSNDIHFGLYAVNLPTFAILQMYIAGRLGVKVGTQTHMSNSLHVYMGEAQPGPRAARITDRMLLHQSTSNYPKHQDVFGGNLMTMVTRHAGFAEGCSNILEDKSAFSGSEDLAPFLPFARQFLKMYREHDWKPQFLPFREEYADWIQAGQSFVDQVWK